MEFQDRTDRLDEAIEKYEAATGDAFGSAVVPWGCLTEVDVIRVLEKYTVLKQPIDYEKCNAGVITPVTPGPGLDIGY